MDMLRNASLFARLSLALAFVPLVMAVVYAVRPTERHLALMRPLSLAGLFAALSGTVLGLINALIRARIPYDLMLFPDERHMPRRLEDRVYMEERIRDFFLSAL
jgi:hypothetical protein